MEIDEVREFATAIGIPTPHLFADKEALIHIIQLEMGYQECFSSDLPCSVPSHLCIWGEDCKNNPLNHPCNRHIKQVA